MHDAMGMLVRAWARHEKAVTERLVRASELLAGNVRGMAALIVTPEHPLHAEMMPHVNPPGATGDYVYVGTVIGLKGFLEGMDCPEELQLLHALVFHPQALPDFNDVIVIASDGTHVAGNLWQVTGIVGCQHCAALIAAEEAINTSGGAA